MLGTLIYSIEPLVHGAGGDGGDGWHNKLAIHVINWHTCNKLAYIHNYGLYLGTSYVCGLVE